jgi:hypothetical protein
MSGPHPRRPGPSSPKRAQHEPAMFSSPRKEIPRHRPNRACMALSSPAPALIQGIRENWRNYYFDNRIYCGKSGGVTGESAGPARGGAVFWEDTNEEKNASRRGACRDQQLTPAAWAQEHHRRRELVEFPGRALEDRRSRDQGRARGRRRDLCLADAQSSSAKQLSDVESLIAQGVDALIILAQDASAIGPAVQAAADEGIPVIGLRPPDRGPARLLPDLRQRRGRPDAGPRRVRGRSRKATTS